MFQEFSSSRLFFMLPQRPCQLHRLLPTWKSCQCPIFSTVDPQIGLPVTLFTQQNYRNTDILVVITSKSCFIFWAFTCALNNFRPHFGDVIQRLFTSFKCFGNFDLLLWRILLHVFRYFRLLCDGNRFPFFLLWHWHGETTKSTTKEWKQLEKNHTCKGCFKFGSRLAPSTWGSRICNALTINPLLHYTSFVKLEIIGTTTL